jgi:hypothetical protein
LINNNIHKRSISTTVGDTPTIVEDVEKIFSCTETIFSATETMVEVPAKIVLDVETLGWTITTIVFIIETAVCETKTLFSEAEPIFCASETGFSITENRVGEMPAVFVQKTNESFLRMGDCPRSSTADCHYAWLHGNPLEVVVNCIKPDSTTTAEVLSEMKAKVEELLQSKHIPQHMFVESMITRRILSHVNG